MSEKDKIEKAIEFAVKYGGIDGDHHKAWVIDQMVRALTGCPMIKCKAIDYNGHEYTYESQGESKEYVELVKEAKERLGWTRNIQLGCWNSPVRKLDINSIDYSDRVIEGEKTFIVEYFTTEEIKNKMTFWQKLFLNSFELCEITNTINMNLYYLVGEMSTITHKKPTLTPLRYVCA